MISTVSIDAYLRDASGYAGEAEQVFLPSSKDELVQLVHTCSAGKIPLTVSGAGTGLTGARVPHGGFVVSLEKFRDIQIEQGHARCGAGVLLRDLQHAAAQTNQFFGPNPTEDTACMGGIASTNAGGARSFHYGSVRHHIRSLQVTFMDGSTAAFRRGDLVDFPITPVRTPATTKNSAGYYLKPGVDWVNLLCGSEGTLGVITEMEISLLPEPGAVLSGVVFFPLDEYALDAIEAWRPLHELRLLEYMDAPGLNLLRPSYPEIPAGAEAALLIEQNLSSEDDPELDEWTIRLLKQRAFEHDSWFGFRSHDRERFRAFRHALPAIVTDLARRNGFSKFSTDLAVPIERHRELHAYYKRRCGEVLPGKFTIFGHAGDANNHINLLPTTKAEAQSGEELMHEFAAYIVSLGGTVAAEHGIGKTKTDLLPLMYLPWEIDAMKNVKRRLDPDWLLGRGNIFAI
ncbi:MAG: FAD-binding oxidoreductase [Acidobacteriaceae bacterium]|nr:FAD-binding oxidoreductase [Acidobacteriaceae bacterium]MBV8571070.1 FAD-binding oxidoreductase [Acidobacteriaceae bacterium]